MNKDNGGPAFPGPVMKPMENYYPGLTMRDYFAAKAMQGFAADPNASWSRGITGMAEHAYQWADAMLNARK